MRREFPAKVKREAWKRSGHRCESALVSQLAGIGCNATLTTGGIFYEHITPDGLTGEPTLDNCAVLCKACWRIKTATYDQPQVARAKRLEQRHAGIRAPKRKIPQRPKARREPKITNIGLPVWPREQR